MAAIMRIRVTLAGAEPVTVDAHTRHQIRWERHARASKIPAAPGERGGFAPTEYAAFLAWAALTDAGVPGVPDTFDAFTDVLDDLAADDDEPPGPTRPAAG